MHEPDVIAAPYIQPPGAVRDPRWREEYRAFMNLLPELLKTHRDKFVAIHNAGVVAVADTLKDAAMEAYERVGYVPLHVGLVSDAPLPTVRVPSPRLGFQAASA
jgi:hypothetical protein